MRSINAASSLALLALILAAAGACSPAANDDANDAAESAAAATAASYLYVWTAAEVEGESDFLAVIDADPASGRYGEVVSSVPAGVRGDAHHSEHVMPEGDHLFVNSFDAGASFVIDLSDPLDPRVAAAFEEMGDYNYPHTFERLPSGNVLATFQTKGAEHDVAGGLVELDPMGGFVRAADAADPVDPELRAYSVTPIPKLDRAVSTTTDMRGEVDGRSFQVWRLSDLTLLKTVMLPPGPGGYEHGYPAEVRLLPDSVTAMMTTFACGLYRLRGLETDQPSAEFVSALPWTSGGQNHCGIPATTDDIWLQTYANTEGSSLISMDISDPSNPTVLDELDWDGDWTPHWISIEPGGERVVLTSGEGETKYRVLIVSLDPATGALAFDETFRDPGSEQIGVSFERMSWPHGEAGTGKPHGAVFSRR
ncbi:MAG: hypothetical protein ABFS34_04880 [Gemmatimonadota bacterium]